MTQKIYLMRHGERPDSFVQTFLEVSFDEDGNYLRKDMNHPLILPVRSDGWKAFALDPPLTQTGSFVASLVGAEYKAKGIQIDHIYSSPALRCVETAASFLKGYGSNLQIGVETGLFEYMTYPIYEQGHPSWMTIGDLAKAGFPVKETEQILDEAELRHGETFNDLYNRSERVIRKLMARHSGESILCVGHGSTLESFSRPLTGKSLRDTRHFRHVQFHSVYLANIELVQHENGFFEITGCPVRPLKVAAIEPIEDAVYKMTDEEIEEDIKLKEEKVRKFLSA